MALPISSERGCSRIHHRLEKRGQSAASETEHRAHFAYARPVDRADLPVTRHGCKEVNNLI
jgi:hypothetical protein